MIFFILAVILVFVVIFAILYNYHYYVNTTKDRCDGWDYGTFRDLQSEYGKRDYSQYSIENHLLGKSQHKWSSLTPYWIDFEGTGMILSFWDYRKYLKFLKEKTGKKLINNKQKAVWSKKSSAKLSVVRNDTK
jgi:hypothetical protein